MAAHTPGPWRAVIGNGCATVKASDCAIYINVRRDETDETVKRWQADACLIAAAPDLLAALRDIETGLFEIIEEDGGVGFPDPQPPEPRTDKDRALVSLIVVARAAIAKCREIRHK